MFNWIKLSTLATAAAVISISTLAQDPKDKSSNGNTDRNSNSNTEKNQEIIIRKNGSNSEKLTIVVDGDKVTINGKPVDEFSNKNVTVLRRNGTNSLAPSRPRGLTMSPNSRLFENGDGASSWSSNKAMLGVTTAKAENGAKVNEVTHESAADKAGLQKNDVITKVENKKIETPEDLVEVIGEHKPNDKVDITYLRDGKENKTTATLSENKTRAYSFNINPDINFDLPRSLDNLTYSLGRKPKIGLQIQDVEEGKGVTVKDVDEDSPASKAGIKEGDVITQFNGKDVAGVDDLRNEVRDVKEGDTVKLSYKRGGKVQTAELKIPKRLRTADL